MSLAERSAELRELRKLFADGRRGGGAVVLIEGAAGTGKTSLLHAFAEHAVEAGGVFLSASASRVECNLPLSAAGQLFHSPALSTAETERAEQLLKYGLLAAMAHGAGQDSESVAHVPPPVLSELCRILLDVAERSPLVIGVDDVHHADAPSLQFLVYLARRARRRVLMVLTECLRTSRPYSVLHADLLRQPGSRHLRLEPLSSDGVAAALSDRLDSAAVRRVAPEFHQVSGGNPLLVQALCEDFLMRGDQTSGGPVFGEAFRQAVLTCLYHSESRALARAVAVLSESASGALLGEIVQRDAVSIGLARDALQGTGLLDTAGFRHPAVSAAVLSGMRPDERTALYLRAAEVLHGHGAPAQAVAGRLLDADRAPAPWAVAVLRDAAEQERADGEPARAISFLRLALQECADEDQRPAVQLELGRAEWQVDPATAARHLPELVAALREGRLPPESAATLLSWMLWLGRVDDAVELLGDTPLRSRDHAPVTGFEPHTSLWWLRYAYPGLARKLLVERAFPPRGEGVPVPASSSFRIDAMLESLLRRGGHREATLRAEQLLGETGVGGRAWKSLTAIATLVTIDELDRAERACVFLETPASGWTPLEAAVYAALRASIHARRGELEPAEQRAHEALSLITPKGWGVAVGIPLAIILWTLTARGRYEKAETYLDTPVSQAMFHTPHALPYLQARGKYYLAVERPKAALAEFRACGDLMTNWSLDMPAFVPWRTDLAEAHLALGNGDVARALATEQLKRLNHEQFRTRGITLRVLGRTVEGEQRMRWLGAAVQALERSGDRLELSGALADLAAAYRDDGHVASARAMTQRSRQLAAECGAAGALAAETPELESPEQPAPAAGDGVTELSQAERRVAALAAGGFTNRQIARRLHVTMSTVEQHLTRAYRKLKINGRSDLPLDSLLWSKENPA
ncbi:AAA family ATPase [Streptomyces sp. B6B3]|uniref:AAA family ATPase n=1 Tax=Streptomyces sp. B6B3 TaxID=3153570 RepID=UPI00325E16AB